MSVQDELLSFQIKETIFLSSDKANIGEMKELEIVPDVEIIENNNEISITGCLQLHGRYEPARNAQATQTGGTDSLLEAMKFTPFQLQDEEAKRFLHGTDAELVHRIPLNVSIPLSRIEDLSDIYAIIDSFDYEVKTPHQLQIQADLKIAGIHLKSQATSQQAEVTPAGATDQESWEFVHVANTPEEIVQPTSIEEIERKLAELEREVESREHYQASQQEPSPFGSTPFVSTPYPQSLYPPAPYASAPYTPAPYVSEQAKAQSEAQSQPYNPWAYQGVQPTRTERESAVPFEAVTDVQETTDSYTEFEDSVAAVHAEPYTQLDLEPEDEQAASPGHISVSIKEQDKVIDFQSAYDERQASIEENQDAPLEVDIASDTESADLLEAHQYPEELAEEVNAEEVQVEEAQVEEAQIEEAHVEEAQVEEAQIEEAHVEEAQVEEAQVEEAHVEEAQTEAEVKEMRVAIGSKPTKEKDESLSITSMFTNAGRPKTEQAVEGRSAESTASTHREAHEVVRSSATELKSGLTSFVRDNEQQFSRLKMCIIQREETIQMIADRYALPVSRLVEVNRLSSDRIAEGQVLYIPQ